MIKIIKIKNLFSTIKKFFFIVRLNLVRIFFKINGPSFFRESTLCFFLKLALINSLYFQISLNFPQKVFCELSLI